MSDGGGVSLLAGADLSVTGSSVLAPAGHRAGTVDLSAEGMLVLAGSTVAARTAAVDLAEGSAGTVTLSGASVEVRRSLITAATAADLGAALPTGKSSANLFAALSGMADSPAGTALGGTITLDATGTDLRVVDATVAATAGVQGNIDLLGALSVRLTTSAVQARAMGVGGQITIDPPLVVLSGDTIDGRSGTRDVSVKVVGRAVLRSGDTAVLSDRTNLSVDLDVVKGLGRLAGALTAAATTLADRCGVTFGQSAPSSFVVTGAGGTPAAPGGWVPAPADDDDADAFTGHALAGD